MDIGLQLKRFLGIDYMEDYVFKNSELLRDLTEDRFINNTHILKGNNKCNLILKRDSNIEIQGEFHGKIIGLGNNIVRISGIFKGILSCQKVIILRGGKVGGRIWYDKLIIQDKKNAKLHGEFRGIQLVPNTYSSEKINFDYIKKIE